MADWQQILQMIRARPIWTRKYDWRKYWSVIAYREYSESPDPIMRARAFEIVLQNIPLGFYDGEKICGSCQGFLSDSIPPNLSQTESLSSIKEYDFVGHRDFVSGWDHSLADYPTLLRIGIDGYIKNAKNAQSRFEQKNDTKKVLFLESILICLQAFKSFILRWALEAEKLKLIGQAKILRKIAGPAPQTLYEALQLVWMTHIVFKTENRYHMALGRIDQYLYPYYMHAIQYEKLSSDEILDLFCHLWVRFEEIGEVQNICIGGLTPEGYDATNELSYICLEATKLVQSPYTNLSARFHDTTPSTFHEKCADVIRTGVGFPAIFNDEVLVKGLVNISIPIEVARDYCMVGCIETMLPGRQPPWSDSRFNLLFCFSKALDQLCNSSSEEKSYERLWELFESIMSEDLIKHVQKINAKITSYPAEFFSDPFLSGLTRDCLERGLDINDGGALFPRFHGIAGMGLASTADSFAAVKKLVFEEKLISLENLIVALDSNFVGHDSILAMLQNKAPKYGNQDSYVDEIAAKIVEKFSNAVLNHFIPTGGRYLALMAANISNIPAGKEVKATPDGRYAWTPLSDAASPYFGRDLLGPTAFLGSVQTPDYTETVGGTVINMKFDPILFKGEEGIQRLTAFTKIFVEKRIPELQFNFTGNEILLDAINNPSQHTNLVVRVSGFSAYFISLDKDVQNDIIRRRAHS